MNWNIGVIGFMQGIPLGLKVYNGYSYVVNTMNKEMVTENTVCYTDSTKIHKYDCEKLVESNLKGHKAYLFEKIQVENTVFNNATQSYETTREWTFRTQSDYRNPSGTYEQFNYGGYEECYYCMISNNYTKIVNNTRKKLMLETVAREKYRLYSKANELNI